MSVRSTAESAIDSFAPEGASIPATAEEADAELERLACEHDPTGLAALAHRRVQASQVSSVIAGITVAASLIVGIFVVAEINGAIPSISNSDLSSARTDTVGITGSAMQVGAVIVLVIFASIILSVLQGL
jgi:hypothetical protein